jgi:hypothetical protein
MSQYFSKTYNRTSFQALILHENKSSSNSEVHVYGIERHDEVNMASNSTAIMQDNPANCSVCWRMEKADTHREHCNIISQFYPSRQARRFNTASAQS